MNEDLNRRIEEYNVINNIFLNDLEDKLKLITSLKFNINVQKTVDNQIVIESILNSDINNLHGYYCTLKSDGNLYSLDISGFRGAKPNMRNLSFLSSSSFLVDLEELDISENKIEDITHIKKLKKLRTIIAETNKIAIIDSILELKELEYLDLDRNLITDVEDVKKLLLMPKLKYLSLYSNPINNIDKNLLGGNCFISLNDYFRDLEKGKQKNNEVKVVFIGNGSVGKTQIAKRLAEKEAFVFDSQHDSTHAITLLRTAVECDFLPEGLQLNLWDFGGQDLYHATHRLFMQTRALFVLVWDVENEANPHHTWEGVQYKNEPLQYWLKYASHFGKDSPILVVQNKVDTKAQEEPCIPRPERETLQRQFPNIIGFWQCSAKTGYRFKALERQISKVFNQNDILRQDLIERELPTAWVQVRNSVRAEQAKSDGAKQISKDIFRAWCAEADVEKSAETILQFFHDTGVLFYQARYFEGAIILDQAWAIKAVYKVLDKGGDYYHELQDELGRLDSKWINKIWKEHTDEERELFIRYMRSADLCFENPQEENVFIVPQLLKPTKPTYLETYRQDYAMHEKKMISYNFLPAFFIQHFIVRAHRLAKVEDMWQAGIYLAYQDQRAIVEAVYDNENSRIVLAYSAQSVELVQAITEELKAISQNTDIRAGEKKGLARFFGEMQETFAEKIDDILANKDVTSLKNDENIHNSDKESKNNEKLRILWLTSNALINKELDLDKEYANTEKQLQNFRDTIDLRSAENINFQELMTETLDVKPHFLHFSGHGATEGLMLQNTNQNGSELVKTEVLEMLFEVFKERQIPLRAVILNACYSERQAEAINEFVKYVIGTTLSIPDTHAIAFSVGFYTALVREPENIESAFRLGQVSAVQAGASRNHFVIFKKG